MSVICAFHGLWIDQTPLTHNYINRIRITIGRLSASGLSHVHLTEQMIRNQKREAVMTFCFLALPLFFDGSGGPLYFYFCSLCGCGFFFEAAAADPEEKAEKN